MSEDTNSKQNDTNVSEVDRTSVLSQLCCQCDCGENFHSGDNKAAGTFENTQSSRGCSNIDNESCDRNRLNTDKNSSEEKNLDVNNAAKNGSEEEITDGSIPIESSGMGNCHPSVFESASSRDTSWVKSREKNPPCCCQDSSLDDEIRTSSGPIDDQSRPVRTSSRDCCKRCFIIITKKGSSKTKSENRNQTEDECPENLGKYCSPCKNDKDETRSGSFENATSTSGNQSQSYESVTYSNAGEKTTIENNARPTARENDVQENLPGNVTGTAQYPDASNSCCSWYCTPRCCNYCYRCNCNRCWSARCNRSYSSSCSRDGTGEGRNFVDMTRDNKETDGKTDGCNRMYGENNGNTGSICPNGESYERRSDEVGESSVPNSEPLNRKSEDRTNGQKLSAAKNNHRPSKEENQSDVQRQKTQNDQQRQKTQNDQQKDYKTTKQDSHFCCCKDKRILNVVTNDTNTPLDLRIICRTCGGEIKTTSICDSKNTEKRVNELNNISDNCQNRNGYCRTCDDDTDDDGCQKTITETNNNVGPIPLSKNETRGTQTNSQGTECLPRNPNEKCTQTHNVQSKYETKFPRESASPSDSSYSSGYTTSPSRGERYSYPFDSTDKSSESTLSGDQTSERVRSESYERTRKRSRLRPSEQNISGRRDSCRKSSMGREGHCGRVSRRGRKIRSERQSRNERQSSNERESRNERKRQKSASPPAQPRKKKVRFAPSAESILSNELQTSEGGSCELSESNENRKQNKRSPTISNGKLISNERKRYSGQDSISCRKRCKSPSPTGESSNKQVRFSPSTEDRIDDTDRRREAKSFNKPERSERSLNNPGMSSKNPGMSFKNPDTSYNKPGSSYNKPGSSYKPDTSYNKPASSYNNPESSYNKPAYNNSVTSSKSGRSSQTYDRSSSNSDCGEDLGRKFKVGRKYYTNAYLNYYVGLFRERRFRGIAAPFVAKYAGRKWRKMDRWDKRRYYDMAKVARRRMYTSRRR